MILDGTIVNADVNASAAIAGTKISPDFGAQNVVTTGTSTAASLIPTSSSVPTNGVYLPAANTVGVATNSVERIKFGTTEAVVNDAGNNYDFRVEGDTNANLLFVDASSDAVGIGTSTPDCRFQVSGGSAITTLANSYSNCGILHHYSSSTLLAIGNDGTSPILQGVNATSNTARNILLNPLGGSVGIATTSPQVDLQIGNADGSSRDIVLHSLSNGNARLRFREGGTVTSAYNEYSFGMIGNANAMSWEAQGLGEIGRWDTAGRLLVGTSSASGQALAQVAGNIQQAGVVYSSAVKTWSTAAAAALFQVNMNTGHCGAELTFLMQDTSYPNGVRTGKIYIAVRGSGSTKSVVAIVQEDKVSISLDTISTITWTAAIVSNEVRLTATPSTDSGAADVYLWGSSPFFTSNGIAAL